MAHQSTSSVAGWRPGRLLAVAATLMLGSAADCLDELEDPAPCLANCAIEVECGLRTQAACEAASCDPVSGALQNPVLDACLAAATDCLEAAACACDGGCAKLAECSGDPDPTCVETCDTLVDQEPVQQYQENTCRIDSSCEDLAACSSVSG